MFRETPPSRVMEFLKVTNQSAESIWGTVFRKQNRIVIERILDDAGIANVTIDEPLRQDDEGCVEQPDDESRVEQPDGLLQADHVNHTRGQTRETPTRRMRSSPSPSTPNRSIGLLTPASGQSTPAVNIRQNASYGKIFENIVAAARYKAANEGVRMHSHLFTFLAGSAQVKSLTACWSNANLIAGVRMPQKSSLDEF